MISLSLPVQKGLVCLFVATLFFAACKKDDAPKPEAAKGTRTELTADSIFLYAKEIYLWNDKLPSYNVFRPRSYVDAADELRGFGKELFAITALSGKEKSIDGEEWPKYSYITETDQNGSVSRLREKSGTSLDGWRDDLGILLRFDKVKDGDRYRFFGYVKVVYPGSESFRANVKRGDVITGINGRDITAYTQGNADIINAAFSNDKPLTLTITEGESRGGAYRTRELQLRKHRYYSNPVLKDSVYTINDTKIGYFAYSSFTDSLSSITVMNKSFARFERDGVKKLVIDLRYNGGGFIATAQHLINLLAPSSLSGKTMFVEHFNRTMQEGRAEILKNQLAKDRNDQPIPYRGRFLTYADDDYRPEANIKKFNKAPAGMYSGAIDVVFIITEATASASELTINSLKPYLNCFIIGQQSYGKPVGFFPVTIDKYDLYLSMFETRNSRGEGGYYDGLRPDLEDLNDDVLHQLGDAGENYLSLALARLSGQPLRRSTGERLMMINGKKVKASSGKEVKLIQDRSFKGMIEDRLGRVSRE